MPTISRFMGIAIAMFYDDHGLTPDITEVAVVGHGVLRLGFADGTTVRRVSIDAETGTVARPGGADLAPDTLYERVRTGAWPDQDVAA